MIFPADLIRNARSLALRLLLEPGRSAPAGNEIYLKFDYDVGGDIYISQLYLYYLTFRFVQYINRNLLPAA